MDIRTQYDVGDVAKKYNDKSSDNQPNDLGRAFLRKEASLLPQTNSILDVGCGIGLDLSSLRQMGFLKLHGIDPSQKSIDEAKKINDKNIEFKLGSFEKIPYEDQLFDTVISRHALHYSKDIEKCINEVSRVLKSGGKFIAVISHPFADALEKRNGENVCVSLFKGEVQITFPLHTLSEYFSDTFLKNFTLEKVYEYAGNERDSAPSNINTLAFVSIKK